MSHLTETELSDRPDLTILEGSESRASETDEAGPLVSVVVATYNRTDDLVDAIESALAQDYRPLEVVVVSNSGEPAAGRETALFEPGGRFADAPVHYLHFPDRVGVPEARNVGYRYASGEYLVTIDDDAVLPDPSAAGRVVEAFEAHDDVGALAFESRSHDTGERLLMEIPSPPTFEVPPAEPTRVSSFCGVGNAFRRSVVLDLGGYASDFVYGFEEQDLSLRLLDAGWDLLYCPSIVVRHKRSQAGRLPESETRLRRVENRIKIAIRNLPRRYVVMTALVWLLYGLVTARLHPGPVIEVVRRLYDQRDSLLDSRSVVDATTLALLKSRSNLVFAWWYGPHPRRFLVNPGRARW